MKKVAARMVLIALLPLVLTACNTIKGVGKDITATGEAIEKSTK